MTATERIINPRLKHKAKEKDYVIFSMDDEKIYGPVFHRFTFGEAIKAKAISDYKIVVLGEHNAKIQKFLKQPKVMKVEGKFSNLASSTDRSDILVLQL